MKNLWNKIFGKKEKNVSIDKTQSEDPLHLWEDDYLMIELVSAKNKEFIEKETQRIDEF